MTVLFIIKAYLRHTWLCSGLVLCVDLCRLSFSVWTISHSVCNAAGHAEHFIYISSISKCNTNIFLSSKQNQQTSWLSLSAGFLLLQSWNAMNLNTISGSFSVLSIMLTENEIIVLVQFDQFFNLWMHDVHYSGKLNWISVNISLHVI